MAVIEWNIPALIRWKGCAWTYQGDSSFYIAMGTRGRIEALAEFCGMSGIGYRVKRRPYQGDYTLYIAKANHAATT